MDTKPDGPRAPHAESGVQQSKVAKDFDRIVDQYEEKINAAIAFGGAEHQFYIDVKRDHILRLIGERVPDLAKLHVLDLGCGIGAYHGDLADRFATLHGVDVSARSLAVAAARHPSVRYACYDGVHAPYADGSFDVIFTICVMHHVPPAQWSGFVAEAKRVLRGGGLALVFEHNPYNPATQYIVKSCDIDKDAVLLHPGRLRRLFADAGFADIGTRSILSVLPKGRALTAIDGWLGALPFGAQYYLRATRPDGGREAP